MTNYFQLGREAIVEASKAQLKMIKGASRVVYATGYGSSAYLFEMALRRIGEPELASKFIDPNPKVLVERVSSYDDFLTAIIANIERGKTDFAGHLESEQRQEFYLKDAGYVDPHFRRVMTPWLEIKEKLRTGVLERGLSSSVPEGGHVRGNKRYMEKARESYEYLIEGRLPFHLKDLPLIILADRKN